MYKARRIGKFAEQSGPQLLHAVARHEENDEKNIAMLFAPGLYETWKNLRAKMR